MSGKMSVHQPPNTQNIKTINSIELIENIVRCLESHNITSALTLIQKSEHLPYLHLVNNVILTTSAELGQMSVVNFLLTIPNVYETALQSLHAKLIRNVEIGHLQRTINIIHIPLVRNSYMPVKSTILRRAATFYQFDIILHLLQIESFSNMAWSEHNLVLFNAISGYRFDVVQQLMQLSGVLNSVQEDLHLRLENIRDRKCFVTKEVQALLFAFRDVLEQFYLSQKSCVDFDFAGALSAKIPKLPLFEAPSVQSSSSPVTFQFPFPASLFRDWNRSLTQYNFKCPTENGTMPPLQEKLQNEKLPQQADAEMQLSNMLQEYLNVSDENLTSKQTTAIPPLDPFKDSRESVVTFQFPINIPNVIPGEEVVRIGDIDIDLTDCGNTHFKTKIL